MVLEKRAISLALKSILSVDRRIRCVVACDLEGKMRANVLRKGVESLEPEAQTKFFVEQAAIGAGMGHSGDGYHGRIRMVIVVREKLILIVFSLFEGVILVSADPDLPLEKTPGIGERLDMMEEAIFPTRPVPTKFDQIKGDLR
ncbi:MAG: hypothetical protein OK452_08265 [Thaumarchaeota archaeon]|nr:hypothetical protein [Nitrososphaerota archaeon]